MISARLPSMRPRGVGNAKFQPTSWSLVIAAGQRSAPTAEAALSNLCRIYWYPVYAFIRRCGYSVDDASDLTQEFFSRVLERNYLSSADPARGRFRSYLLAAVRHFLANEWDHQHAQKRGGGATMISLDIENAERRYSAEPADRQDPEKLYARQWALALLDEVLSALREEYADEGKLDHFNRVAPLLAGGDTSYSDIARDWNSSEGAVRVAVHRARKKYRDLLRKMISETVASPEEVDFEVQFLLSALELPK